MIRSETVQTKLGLSIIIITLNEEKDIEACLQSVASIADEIVVVDSGSTDRTLEICKQFTSKVFPHPFQGYGPEKQVALDKAQGPWVLSIDADERVSSGLGEEIRRFLTDNSKASSIAGVNIPFNHYFLGKRLRFGGSAGEHHIRLYRKDSAHYGPDKIHEGITVTGVIARMKNPIDHYSYRDLQEYLTKCNEYTSLIAEKKFNRGERFHIWNHLRLPFEFIVRYIFKLGFLDGQAGLVYAALSSYYVWLKFIKLRDREVK